MWHLYPKPCPIFIFEQEFLYNFIALSKKFCPIFICVQKVLSIMDVCFQEVLSNFYLYPKSLFQFLSSVEEVLSNFHLESKKFCPFSSYKESYPIFICVRRVLSIFHLCVQEVLRVLSNFICINNFLWIWFCVFYAPGPRPLCC